MRFGCDEVGVMGYWLMKTEPGEWGWEHQERNGGLSQWDGVRSAQAQGHMRRMRLGDFAFFYHSGKGAAVVGVVEVVRGAYPDISDATGKHCMVDVRAVAALPSPVSLTTIKRQDTMRDWILVRQSRLSVMPVSPSVWARVCELGDLSPPPCVSPIAEDAPASEINLTSPKKTPKKKKKQNDCADTGAEPTTKRARRMPTANSNGNNVPTHSREDVNQPELKTYQRGTRGKVDIVEAAVVARKAPKRGKSRGVR